MARRRRSRSIDKQVCKAQIEKLSHEGWGIAHKDGGIVFIQGALPTEEVEYIHTEKRKDYAKGIVQGVIQPSAERVQPPCEHYNICGGCSFQHLDPVKQIQFKQSILLEQLAHIGQTKPRKIIPPLVGEQLGYRHKARLSVRFVNKKNSVLIGFRERGSGRFVADIKACKILAPKVGMLIQPLRELIATLSAYDAIAQIEVAVGENKVILILRHLEALNSGDHNKLKYFADQHDISWYLQPGGPDTIHPLCETDNGLLEYCLPEQDIKFEFKPDDFTQVNPSINRQMVGLAIDLLDIQPTDKVLDLFCGLGNFSLAMAKKASSVVGVEGCTKMTERASNNAKLNSITNTTFYSANLFENLVDEPWVDQSYAKILLDPPRAGAKEICEQIERFNAEKIVYVSCATATLARDAKILKEKGYILEQTGVMDMFPHTAHVESIALFVKA